MHYTTFITVVSFIRYTKLLNSELTSDSRTPCLPHDKVTSQECHKEDKQKPREKQTDNKKLFFLINRSAVCTFINKYIILKENKWIMFIQYPIVRVNSTPGKLNIP